MSADNTIQVRKINDKWTVWEDSASNENPIPTPEADTFDKKSDAILFARGMERGIGYVEYGIHIEEDEEKEEILGEGMCDHCRLFTKKGKYVLQKFTCPECREKLLKGE